MGSTKINFDETIHRGFCAVAAIARNHEGQVLATTTHQMRQSDTELGKEPAAKHEASLARMRG